MRVPVLARWRIASALRLCGKTRALEWIWGHRVRGMSCFAVEGATGVEWAALCGNHTVRKVANARNRLIGGRGDLGRDPVTKFGLGAGQIIGHLQAQPDSGRTAEITS